MYITNNNIRLLKFFFNFYITVFKLIQNQNKLNIKASKNIQVREQNL